MKHTPWPWRVERQNPSPTTGEWMIAGSKPGYLAEVRDCGSGDVKANAQLIASAPDLLEALQKAQQDINWMLNNKQFLNGEVFDYIDAAIAKATGKPHA